MEIADLDSFFVGTSSLVSDLSHSCCGAGSLWLQAGLPGADCTLVRFDGVRQLLDSLMHASEIEEVWPERLVADLGDAIVDSTYGVRGLPAWCHTPGVCWL